jgi:predicted AAA+ superfamily ATPase
MSMRYATSGSIVNLTSDRDEIVTDELPAKTYTINFNQMSGQFFLKITEDMKLPQKIFGDTEIVARRIINTFLSRPEQTGVHLTGEKGSGKTLLMKIISKILRDEYDIPTVLVNNSFQGEAFNSFISSIETRTLVIFDEFEKIYGYDDQQQLLTLFDGTRNSKKLFMVSSNDYSSVSSQMSNRPGRVYLKVIYFCREE